MQIFLPVKYNSSPKSIHTGITLDFNFDIELYDKYHEVLVFKLTMFAWQEYLTLS